MFLLTISCQGDFIYQNGDFSPSLEKSFKILESRFGIFDLFHLDSAVSSQQIILENELANNTLNFSSLLPQDSTYSENLGLLSSTESFLVANHDDIVLSLNQLNFIQYFSPSDFNLFNSNNGSSINWSGFNSYTNYYFGAVSAPEVFDAIHIDSAFYDIAIVNNFDFDVTIGVSLKSNPSIIFSQTTTIASGDSANYTVLVTDIDANASYNWTVYQASSNGFATGSAPINNNNLLEVKVSRTNAYLSSGKFRPVNNILAQFTKNLPLPVAYPHEYNYFEGENLEFDNFITATGLNGTNLSLYRSFKDKNSVVYSDVINVISIGAAINWIAPLSNLPIVPNQGMIEVSYILQGAQNSIIDISPNKSVSILHGFQNSPDISAIGFKENSILSFTSKSVPFSHWPEELQLSFIPDQSRIDRKLNFIGWGDINIQSQFKNHIGSMLIDSVQFNLGNSHLDAFYSQLKQWTLNNPSVNNFNALTPDSIEVTTNILFKAPWGIRLKYPAGITSTSFTSLKSTNGSAVLSSEQDLDISNNEKLDSIIASCDSVLVYAKISSNTQNDIFNTISLTKQNDTIVSFNRILLSANNNESSTERTIENPMILNSLMKFNYMVDFATPAINLNTSDSLFFELYFKLYGLP